MIPSLVVSEVRHSLVEYLATTFALCDDSTRDALSEFLTKEGDGIFRGPYLSVRTPFQHVDDGWKSPLEWLPDAFLPYAHQAESFERLSSVGVDQPEPTLVTTGTGSGKTECFLYPVLDHCARMRDEGKSGIKALILYPMNALASDQAGRIAELIASETRLAGLTAGLYVGEAGRNSTMGPDHVIDKREAIRADPPDILMTNYKMLDFLLLRNEERNCGRGTSPTPCSTWCLTNSTPTTGPRAPTWPCCFAAWGPLSERLSQGGRLATPRRWPPRRRLAPVPRRGRSWLSSPGRCLGWRFRPSL